MPVKPCQRAGKRGYKWGDSGYCYTYTTGDEESRKRAREKAIEQGRAIQVNKQSSVQALVFSKDKFTKRTSLKWAKSHHFKYDTIRETENTYRIRQFPSSDCKESGGMKELDDGVQAYICIVK
mgnify:CR=1 FL=1